MHIRALTFSTELTIFGNAANEVTVTDHSLVPFHPALNYVVRLYSLVSDEIDLPNKLTLLLHDYLLVEDKSTTRTSLLIADRALRLKAESLQIVAQFCFHYW